MREIFAARTEPERGRSQQLRRAESDKARRKKIRKDVPPEFISGYLKCVPFHPLCDTVMVVGIDHGGGNLL